MVAGPFNREIKAPVTFWWTCESICQQRANLFPPVYDPHMMTRSRGRDMNIFRWIATLQHLFIALNGNRDKDELLCPAFIFHVWLNALHAMRPANSSTIISAAQWAQGARQVSGLITHTQHGRVLLEAWNYSGRSTGQAPGIQCMPCNEVINDLLTVPECPYKSHSCTGLLQPHHQNASYPPSHIESWIVDAFARCQDTRDHLCMQIFSCVRRCHCLSLHGYLNRVSRWSRKGK